MPDSRAPYGAPALVVLAAGLSTRYGRLKQLDPVGPEGRALMDYTIADAVEAGVRRVVMVVRDEIEADVRDHVIGQLERRDLGSEVEVMTGVQRLDDLPGGRTPPAGRTRPWGTAHALHAARHALEGTAAFILVNADDGYGKDAIRRLVRWAASGPPDDEFALVPFRLEATLSDHGGVSRGIVELDDQRLLTGIREAVGLQRDPERPGWVGGRWSTQDGTDGTEVRVELATPVSLNLWGFTPRMSARVADGLAPFMDGLTPDGALSGEYYLPDVVRAAVAEGAVRVRVLTSATDHLGMTYPEDREPVVAALEEARRTR